MASVEDRLRAEATDALTKEIDFFCRSKEELERNHFGKWVLVHEESLIGVYDSFEDAAVDASQRFGRGPYLIREIGILPERLPSAAMYGRGYAYG